MILPVGSVSSEMQLALKMRGSTEITPIPGTEWGRTVVYSPDAQWIAYTVGTDLFKRPLVGGAPVRLAVDADDALNPTLAWLDDGTILYEQGLIAGQPRRIVQIPEDGGDPLVVFAPEAGAGSPSWLQGLPGGRGALVATCGPQIPTCNDNLELYVVDLRDLSSELILEKVLRAWYAPTGHLVYVQDDGALFAAPFDLDALAITGGAIPLLDGVSTTPARAQMQLAANGTLLYVEWASSAGDFELVWVNRSGAVEPVDPAWTESFNFPALSPEGTRLAVEIVGTEGRHIWVKQLDRGPNLKLTFEGTSNGRPTWTPDGGSVTFRSNRAGGFDLWTKRADGSAQAMLELDRERGLAQALWSPDREWLVYRTNNNEPGGSDILALRPGQDTVPVALVVAPEFDEQNMGLSPDGRWLAYSSQETERWEIYVVPFPNAGDAKWAVSTSGGQEPVWSHSGRELFYRNGRGEMVAVQVETEPTFAPGQQEVLFPATQYRTGVNLPRYDVTPDDERFIMVRRAGVATLGELILVQNFFEELKARVPN